jgi:hypothetical protein
VAEEEDPKPQIDGAKNNRKTQGTGLPDAPMAVVGSEMKQD